jgi:hypothetical protein
VKHEPVAPFDVVAEQHVSERLAVVVDQGLVGIFDLQVGVEDEYLLRHHVEEREELRLPLPHRLLALVQIGNSEVPGMSPTTLVRRRAPA